MAHPTRSANLAAVPILGGVLALGMLLVLTGGGVGEPRRPDPKDGDKVKDKRDEEKEDEKAPIKRKPPPDDPESIRTGESDGDLASALRQSRLPVAIKRLYRAVVVPQDVVKLKSGRTLTVALLPLQREQTVPHLREACKRAPIGDDGQSGQEITLAPDTIASIVPYEERAQQAVKAFLKESGELQADEQLAAEERALAWVMRAHESARTQKLREGKGWEAVEESLRRQLIDVLIAQVQQLGESRKWEATFALVNRLSTTYLRDDPTPLAAPLVQILEKATELGTASPQDVREAYRYLRRMEERFPENPSVLKMQDKLEKRARTLFDRGKQLIDTGNKSAEGQALIEQALEIRPNLEGAEKYLTEALQKYPILRVGVRRLPEHFSPAWAATDSELRAMELLFESLVRYSPDEHGAGHYHAGLAEGRPRLVPGGRRFYLPANAFWSNGEPLNSFDVRAMVDRLRKEDSKGTEGTGLSPAWGELFNPFTEVDNVGARGEPGRVDLTLNRGCLEPLSAMTFKLLPRSSASYLQSSKKRLDVASEEFAQKPVVSGPFYLKEDWRRQSNGRGSEFISFKLNPKFAKRAGARDRLPHIQEIQFIQYSDALEAMKAPRQVDLILDLTADEASQLREQERALKVPTPTDLPPNRRIYFLLPGQGGALESADLRRAIAYAINREALLSGHFRGKEKQQIHKALNGPYPAGCWACDPELKNKDNGKSLDPYDPQAALAAFEAYKRNGGRAEPRLRLMYPDGDAPLKAAMEGLCAQVNGVLKGAVLQAEPQPPSSLRQKVIKGDFELVYYFYDFPDEAYWLGPLLGPRGLTGGRGEKVAGLLNRAAGRRDFPEVRSYAHLLHRMVLKEEMPLVPLWQLDPLLAIHPTVKAPPFDPRLVFTDIERWRLAK
jgi:ABC-type transport system substrate-binding protein